MKTVTRFLFLQFKKNVMNSIEDLIHQTNFKNKYQRALISFIYANSILSTNQLEYFKEFGITPQQFNVLRILRGQYPNPATLNLIRERMLEKNSDVSRIVERLKKVGFLERVTCEQDRRAVDVIITQKGLNLLQVIDADGKTDGEIFHCFSKEEIEKFNELLNKFISKNLE